MISASLVKELRELTGAGMLDCKKALEASNGDIKEATTWLREKGIAKAAKKESRIAAEGLADVKISGNKAVVIEVNSETDFVAKNSEFKELVSLLLDAILNNDVKSIDDVLNININSETINDIIIAKTAKIGEKLSFRRFEKVEKTDTQNFGSYIHMGGKIAVLITLEVANNEVAKEVAMHAAAMRPSYVKSSDVPTDVLEKEKNIMREQLLNEGKPADKVENILVGKVNKYYEDVCLENQIFVKAENKQSVSKYVLNNSGAIVSMIRFEVGEGIEKKTEDFASEVAKQINGN